MELCIHFNTLPEGMSLDDVKSDLAVLLEEDGWLTGSAQSPAGGYIELELEDEKANPKYGILTVKGYLQKANLPRRPPLNWRAYRWASTNKQRFPALELGEAI